MNNKILMWATCVVVVACSIVGLFLPNNINASLIKVGTNDNISKIVETYENLEKMIKINASSEELNKTFEIEKSSLIVEKNDTFLTIDEYLATKNEEENGELYVLISDFLTKSQDQINTETKVITHGEFTCDLSSNIVVFGAKEYSSLRKIAIDLGYTYNTKIVDSNLELSREFKERRLIVTSETKPQDNFGAIDEVCGKDYYIYQYQTEYATKLAIKKFIELKTDVSIDAELIQLSSNETNSNEDYTIPSKFHSWGGEMMGFKEYAEYLTTQGRLKEVIVAVVDAGVDASHPELKNRVINSRFDGKLFENGTKFFDGHGTEVAGTIACLTPTNVKILSFTVMSDLWFSSAVCVVCDLIYQLKENGENIVSFNGSFGYKSSLYSKNEDVKAIRRLISRGVACCFAAGNDGENVENHSPSNIPEAITVSAMAIKNAFASFSNYGKGIDFSAPGLNIKTPTINGEYALSTGTSFACPHIAAAAALIASDPRADYNAQEIEMLLRKCAEDIGEEGFDIKFGWGYPNLSKLINDKPFEKSVKVNVKFEVQNQSTITNNFCDVRLGYSLNNIYLVKEFKLENLNDEFSFDVNGETFITAKESNTWKMMGVYLSNDASRGKLISANQDVRIDLKEFSTQKQNTLTIVVRNEQWAKIVINVEIVDDPHIGAQLAFEHNVALTINNEALERRTVDFTTSFLHKDQVFECYSIKGPINEVEVEVSCNGRARFGGFSSKYCRRPSFNKCFLDVNSTAFGEIIYLNIKIRR